MHIKKIVIEGFKSYGGRTVIENIHPGHNVIVGSNGSGKSNFFAAIEFLLSDDYNRLEKAQRQALLHEGSGPRSLTASVEIIFDNLDKRMTVDKNEVSLKRVIGTKKDQYILNKKVVTRSEVVSLMEVAGISRSNPYYIVRQGKVNQVATTSESRLLLLQEIAGVKVYEERRNESFAILNDARLKIKNIDELLETINEKLESLKNETEELKEYQKWDKKTRTIEYIIYDSELINSKSKLVDFKNQHDRLQTEQTELQSHIKTTYLDPIESINGELKNAQRKAKTTEENKDGLSEELEKLLKDRELLRFKINELQHEIQVDIVNRESINTALEELNEKIEKNQEDLRIIKPQYKEEVEKVQEAIRKLESLEKERQILYAKQGRGAQFQNKEERNAWINDEIILINKQISEKLSHIENLKKDINENEEKGRELETSQESILKEMEIQWSSIDVFKKGLIDSNKKKEEQLAERKDLYRKQKTLQMELEYSEEDLKKVNQNLISVFGKGILNGINSVNKVLETFRKRNDMVNELHQYHGLVIQRFDCEENLHKAVEVIAGNRLFYHIVETTRFGSEILKEMNRQNLPGVVSFIPLDHLKASDYNYPKLSNSFPLKERLKYEDRYEIPIRYIFGKIIVTRDLKTGTEIASQHKFDCITLEGDQASSKGWLKGGHFGTSKSAMHLQQKKQKLLEEIHFKKEKLSELSNKIKKVDDEITNNMSEYQRFENKFNKARETYYKLTNDLNNIKEQLQIVENKDLLQNKKVQELTSDLHNLNILKNNLTAELEEDLSDQLTTADQCQIDHMNDSIAKIKKELKNLFKTRENLETEKMKLENLLNKNLYCKKDELNQRLREISLDNKPLHLQSLQEKCKNIINKINNYENELNKNEITYEKAIKQKQDKLKEIENLYRNLKPEQETFEKQSKELEKLFCNIKMLEENIENTKRRMIDLGCIPSNELKARYSRMSKKSLYKELDDCRKNLKKYDHINKRALDQYEIFKDSRENLFKRKEELDRANEKIGELFDFLQQKKDEAVRFTFKQVGKYFTDIFSKIVPGGNAQIVLEQGVARNGSDSSSTTTLDLDNIVGIGIRVSFTGEMTMSDYNQLSGGQKSLLALTLIFAIQKCDPAPFYLFDEIDQALDTAHRRAVAEMIHELSSETQFITTTFRPELLEHANQFYGVRFQSNLSSIYVVTKEDALEFVEEDDGE